MSDTPRTDDMLEWVRPAGDDSGPPNEQYVSADFARQLERLNGEFEDWNRWAKEVLTDYKTPFDDHKVGLRLALTQKLYDVCQENKTLRADKERLDWIQEHHADVTEGRGRWDCYTLNVKTDVRYQDSPRQAIDLARKALEERKHERHPKNGC